MKKCYQIAGLTVLFELPLSPSNFAPFACSETEADMSVILGSVDCADALFLEECNNDAGHLRLYACPDSYLILQDFGSDVYVHSMMCSRDFSDCRVKLSDGDPYLGYAISSLVRIAFSQRLLLKSGFLIHASCVVNDGMAYMFVGESGAGKSTHSELWLRSIPGTYLLNDDCPAIRIVGGRMMAYGTPWSGKTPCYLNESVPLGGLVRIHRSETNRWVSLRGVRAWAEVYPSCSAIKSDDSLFPALVSCLNYLVGSVPVGQLDCLPDEGAALLSYKQLKNII